MIRGNLIIFSLNLKNWLLPRVFLIWRLLYYFYYNFFIYLEVTNHLSSLTDTSSRVSREKFAIDSV